MVANEKEFWISPAPLTAINWVPSLIEDIHQCIRIILGTIKGELILDRNFGIDSEIIDQPMPVARQLLKASVAEAVRKYEPRVIVKEVQIVDTGTTAAAQGTMGIRVLVRIKDGVLHDGDE